MTVPVRQMLVNNSKYSLKCPNPMNAKYITIHNTANDASANSEVKYMNGNNSSTSYHFAIDDKEVVQGIPLNRNAWHCGDGSGSNSGNRTSIGIEICYSKSGGNRYEKAEELAIKFTAQLLHERGWGVDRVRSHNSWSGKNCPHRILNENRWNQFINRIQAELNKLNNPKPQYTETTIYYKNNEIKGLIENGVTFVQIRQLADLLGNIQIGYDQPTNTVTFNNKVVKPLIIEGRSYLPCRETAESIGLKVTWDSVNKVVRLED